MNNGLVALNFTDNEYHMRPTYGAMREIESRTKLSIQELLEVLFAQRLHIHEAALIVWYGGQAAGASFTSIDAVGEAIFEIKVTNISFRSSIAEFLLNCLYAPEEAKKKFDDEVVPILSLSETG